MASFPDLSHEQLFVSRFLMVSNSFLLARAWDVNGDDLNIIAISMTSIRKQRPEADALRLATPFRTRNEA